MLDLKKLLANLGTVQDPRGVGQEGIGGQWIPGQPRSPYALSMREPNTNAVAAQPLQAPTVAPPALDMSRFQPVQQPETVGFGYGRNAPDVAPPAPVAIPTVTAPATAPVDVPAVPAAYDAARDTLNQPLSLENREAMAQANYNNALTEQEHPNKFLSGLYLALQGIGKAFDPQHNNQPIQSLADVRHNEKVAKAHGILAPIQEQQKIAQSRRIGDAQIRNYDEDNRRQATAAQELSDWRKSETNRKIDAGVSRERTSRMNAVAGMFKNIPTYDPADPKFKEMTDALGDVGLPLTPKDAKKKVDLKQDQRSGAWTLILTDPISGKQEVRNVEKDGKPFASTPTVVMQGEYGMLKQNDAQDFTANENDKSRQFQSTMAAAKGQMQAAIKQYGEATAKQKALAAFVKSFQLKNGHPPSDEESQAYISAVMGPLDDE